MRIHIILLAVSGAELGVGAKIGAGAGKVAGAGTGAEFVSGSGSGAGSGAGEDRFSFLCPLKMMHCVGPCSSQPCHSACTVTGLFHR